MDFVLKHFPKQSRMDVRMPLVSSIHCSTLRETKIQTDWNFQELQPKQEKNNKLLVVLTQ